MTQNTTIIHDPSARILNSNMDAPKRRRFWSHCMRADFSRLRQEFEDPGLSIEKVRLTIEMLLRWLLTRERRFIMNGGG